MSSSNKEITIYERDEQRQLNKKLEAIERKIIVGGENLLEKAENQAVLLEQSEKELEKQRLKQKNLKQTITEKEVNIWFAITSNFYFSFRDILLVIPLHLEKNFILEIFILEVRDPKVLKRPFWGRLCSFSNYRMIKLIICLKTP